MATILLALLTAIAATAGALFAGSVNYGGVLAELISLGMAALTGLAIAGAVALDG